MIYRFTIISDEVDDFLREIQISPEATFLDFHKAILKSVGYDDNQLTSFFVCDDDWGKEEEITLEEMDSNSDIDNYVMSDTKIDELVEDEKQKLIYVFDYMTDRCFFVQLSEIITGKDIETPRCTKKEGVPPSQTMDFEEVEKKQKQKDLDLGEDFYGDQGYNDDDIDRDSFEGFDNGSDTSYDSSDIY